MDDNVNIIIYTVYSNDNNNNKTNSYNKNKIDNDDEICIFRHKYLRYGSIAT